MSNSNAKKNNINNFCPNCEGSGKIKAIFSKDNPHVTCRLCGGTGDCLGKNFCQRCRGTGYSDIQAKMICDFCEGTRIGSIFRDSFHDPANGCNG